MVGRDPERTSAAVADVINRTGANVGAVSALVGDLSSQADVRRLAAECRSRHDRLDVLINNAGGVNARRLETVDGIEMTFAVNHLAPFLLTTLLLDLIVRSAPARIVTVSSIGHRQGTLDFDDLGLTRGYSLMRAYSRSKLANVLFASELARRLTAAGVGDVTSNSLHPGLGDTDIWSGAPFWARPFIRYVYRPLFFISPEQSARHVINLAVRPDLASVTGKYFEEGAPIEPSALARDEALARRLWEVSEALTARSARRAAISSSSSPAENP